MARYNTIWAGPTTENVPQVVEAISDVDLTPGLAVTLTAGKFVYAAATTATGVCIVRENYLTMKGVDDVIKAGDTSAGLVIFPHQFYNVLIGTGINVAKGAALALGANGTFVLSGAGARVVAFAEEAFNNTTGSAQLVRVRGASGYRQIA